MSAARQTQTSMQAGKVSDSESIYSETFLEKVKALIKEEIKAEIITELSSKVDNALQQIADVKQEVKSLAETNNSQVSSINTKLEILEFDIKTVANVRQQRERDEGIMIYDVPLPDCVGTSTIAQTNYLFDKLFKPMCIRAKEDGLIQYIPEPSEMIKVCHPVPRKPATDLPVGMAQRPPKSPEAPIIMKLASKNWKALVYKYKREILEAWNKRNSTRERKVQVEILDDLTKWNLACLNWLKSEENRGIIHTAQFRSGKIRYSLMSDPRKFKIVTDTFTRDIKEISKKKCSLI
jgi:hypothetical protein